MWLTFIVVESPRFNQWFRVENAPPPHSRLSPPGFAQSFSLVKWPNFFLEINSISYFSVSFTRPKITSKLTIFSTSVEKIYIEQLIFSGPFLTQTKVQQRIQNYQI